jgi:hypothetical protein
MYMKAVQVLLELLRDLGRDAEVKRDGRSAVLRRAAAEYLRKKRRAGIREAYERAYGRAKTGADDFAGWTEEGSWPED